MVATPYASGLVGRSSTTRPSSAAPCIDFGGGTTTIAVFIDGQFVHADAIAVGGQHITTDIARGLSTRIEDAERLKTMYGSALPGVSDERDILSVPPIGDDERDVPNQVPRSALTRIIRPRVEEILELVRDRLNASGFAALVGRRMVLTGGAQPAHRPRRGGAADSGAQRPPRPAARRRRPAGGRQGAGLRRGGRPPDLSAGRRDGADRRAATTRHFAMTGTGGYFARVGQWIRESF